MTSRDSEFAAFVDERGAALWRTASLLELDADAAVEALTAALAAAARQWRVLSRDGAAELEVRRRLYRHVADRWRRTDRLHEVPPPESLAELTRERQALGALSNADRALVVLTGYESLSPQEANALLRLGVDDPDVALGSANARFRSIAGAAPDAAPLPLLNAAALRDLPPGVEQRALVAARRGGRRTLLLAAASVVAIVAVIVAGTTLLREEPDEASSALASLEPWGVPNASRVGPGLASLREESIEAASMAFVNGGWPFVTDAETGVVRRVLPDEPQPQWYDGNVDGVVTGRLRRGPPWSQAVLSPDGEWLLLVQATSGLEPGATGALYVVRVDTGAVTPVPEAEPAARPWGEASVADSVLAWSPGGGAFACVCDGRLAVFDLEPTAPRVTLATESTLRVTDVAWGGAGLLARLVDGGWVPVSTGEDYLPGLGNPDALAVSLSSPSIYLTVGVTSVYALGADTDPDGGRCVRWDDSFTEPVPVTPAPDRDGDLCTPLALQPGRSGVLLVIRPSTPRPSPPLDVVVVDTFGASTAIATLPSGTTHASFAATLAG